MASTGKPLRQAERSRPTFRLRLSYTSIVMLSSRPRLNSITDDGAYEADDQGHAAEEEYQNDVPRVHHPKMAVVMAMFSLVFAGTAVAFGFRAMFSSARLPMLPPIVKATSQPLKIAHASNEPHTKNGANAGQVDIATTGSIEKLVLREEQPVRIEQPKPTTGAPAVTSAAQRPSQAGAADIAAVSSRANLAAAPVSAADAGYTVQVTSERSESRAQAAFRALQAKYPNQLSGRQPIIRRIDLSAGTYYRALVGPFTSAKEAARSCKQLKDAGGDCTIRKN